MKRNGFTLLELLAVIALIAVIGGTSIVLFRRNNTDVTSEDAANKYKQIQEAAIVYVDLNESWLNTFTTNNEIYVRLAELQSNNYVSPYVKNPINGEPYPNSYLIKIYKDDSQETGEPFVNSCIIDKTTINGIARTICIADNEGNACECSSTSKCCSN